MHLHRALSRDSKSSFARDAQTGGRDAHFTRDSRRSRAYSSERFHPAPRRHCCFAFASSGCWVARAASLSPNEKRKLEACVACRGSLGVRSKGSGLPRQTSSRQSNLAISVAGARKRSFSRVGWASCPPSDASCIAPFRAVLKVRLGETPKPAGGTPTLPETHRHRVATVQLEPL
jgi:hypothetical protein